MHEVIKLSSQGDEPVTLSMLKAWLRLDGDEAEQPEIQGLCPAVRAMAEEYTKRVYLGSVTFRETYYREDRNGGLDSRFSHLWMNPHHQHRAVITLCRGPLVAVTSIVVDEVTVDPSCYDVTGGEKVLPQIRLHRWPESFWKKLVITYAAGTGVIEGDGVAPSPLALQAMQLIAGHLNVNRESQDLPPLAERLLDLDGKLGA